MATVFLKDPDAILDYAFDWSAWLQDGESISTYTITAEDGITVDSYSQADGVVTVWLSGGTVGTNYDVACKIVTSYNRTDERTMTITVLQK